MCQQHLRNYACGHSEYLKPRYCPTSMINGGAPCQPVDVVPRNTDHKCPVCEPVAGAVANQAADPAAQQQLLQRPAVGGNEAMDAANTIDPGHTMHPGQAMHPSQASNAAGDAMDTSEG
jgi:hypothetical protein